MESSHTRTLKVVGVIPARYSSTRFPGKLLAKLVDKPVIQHVYERAKKSKTLSDLIVATDDKKIYELIESIGGRAILTGEHKSGTDRIAEVIKNMEADVVINIQGDEPLIEPSAIDQLMEPFLKGQTSMDTLASSITEAGDLSNPNIVKVVVDKDNFAIYFSRSPIPYPFESVFHNEKEGNGDSGVNCTFLKHIGLYGYKKDFLLTLTALPQRALEYTEKLEQLRVLEYGYRIKVVETEYSSIPVDVPSDIEKIEQLIKKKGR